MLCIAGDVTVDPPSISIPLDQEAVKRWPDFEDDERVGHTTLRFTYEVTKRIAIGGAVDFALAVPTHDDLAVNLGLTHGYLLGPSDNFPNFPFGRFQTERPQDPNYTTARTSQSGTELTISTVPRSADGAVVVRVKVGKRALRRGETFVVTFGDTIHGSPGASYSFHPGRLQVVTFEDLHGTGEFELGAGVPPEVLVTGGTPTSLRINLPVTATQHEEFEGTIEVLQGRDSPMHSLFPCENFVGTIRLEELADTVRSTTITFDASMRGVARFPWTLPDLTIARLRAVELLDDGSEGTLVGYSNPVEVRDRTAETEILCGDLHRHSAEGGHAGASEYQVWQRCWNSRYDFASVIEHSYTEYFDVQYQNRVARLFQQTVDPDETQFVTFPGYEWTLEGTHRHVINQAYGCRDTYTDRKYTGAADPPPTLIKELAPFLDALRADFTIRPSFAIAHHMLWEQGVQQPYDWGAVIDDPVQPVVEIYSGHGSSERRIEGEPVPSDYVMHDDVDSQRPASEEASVQSLLTHGRRIGFVGGSDHHSPVNQQLFPHFDGLFMYARGGLTFVNGERGTPGLRARIWEGIGKRRTYVTTGARMLVSWYATGSGKRRGAGAELTCNKVTLHLVVVPSAVASSEIPGMAAYEIWRDGDVLVDSAEFSTPLETLDVEFTDDSLPRDGQFHSYYAKAIQDDDHVAWASPIWVKYKK